MAVKRTNNNPESVEERIAAILNEDKNPQLKSLVTTWFKSGPNLQKMCVADPQLNLILRNSLRVGYRPSASGAASLELLPGPFEDFWTMLKRHYHRRSPEEAQESLRLEQ